MLRRFICGWPRSLSAAVRPGALCAKKVKIRALLIGVVATTLAILCMLTVTGLNDNVPIIPGPWIEWREAIGTVRA
jgi:hypothetical protein